MPWKQEVRVACDSMVALGPATADGGVWFAKNSDRPGEECQPLAFVGRASYAPSARLRCTYIEIDQVCETAQVIGSRPYWCWGFEHGVNEHGVAIGNHTVFTKDTLAGLGLIGMDLVRLGLERAHSAAAAVEVMIELLEQHGQGGSGYADKDWPYHNSFLVADRHSAFMIETSDRVWVVKQVELVGALSNHTTIGSDWTRISPRAESHAVQQGWCAAGAGRFDFAAAYRDVSMAPPQISSGRYGRTCAALATAAGSIDREVLAAALRDHYGNVAPNNGLTPMDERYFGVCMHAEPVGMTTASVIAQLPAAPTQPAIYWAGLGSPCVGAFVPLWVDAGVPDILSDVSPDGAWWRSKKLLAAVEKDWGRRAPIARVQLDAIEATSARRLPDATTTAAERLGFSRECVAEWLRVVDALLRQWD